MPGAVAKELRRELKQVSISPGAAGNGTEPSYVRHVVALQRRKRSKSPAPPSAGTSLPPASRMTAFWQVLRLATTYRRPPPDTPSPGSGRPWRTTRAAPPRAQRDRRRFPRSAARRYDAPLAPTCSVHARSSLSSKPATRSAQAASAAPDSSSALSIRRLNVVHRIRLGL